MLPRVEHHQRVHQATVPVMITTHLLEEVKVMGLHLQVLEVTGEVPVVEGAEGVTEILTVKIATAAAVTGEEAMVGVASLEEVAMEAEEETMDHLEVVAAVDMEAAAAVEDMEAAAVVEAAAEAMTEAAVAVMVTVEVAAEEEDSVVAAAVALEVVTEVVAVEVALMAKTKWYPTIKFMPPASPPT